jgi:hypothetical protein
MTKPKKKRKPKSKDELKSDEQYRQEAAEYIDRMFADRFGRRPDEYKRRPDWRDRLEKLERDGA